MSGLICFKTKLHHLPYGLVSYILVNKGKDILFFIVLFAIIFRVSSQCVQTTIDVRCRTISSCPSMKAVQKARFWVTILLHASIWYQVLLKIVNLHILYFIFHEYLRLYLYIFSFFAELLSSRCYWLKILKIFVTFCWNICDTELNWLVSDFFLRCETKKNTIKSIKSLSRKIY